MPVFHQFWSTKNDKNVSNNKTEGRPRCRHQEPAGSARVWKMKDIYFHHILRRWIVFFAQSDWFLYFGISCTVHLQVKQDAVQFWVVVENVFLINDVAVARQYQKSNKIWQLGIKRYVFLLLFSNKCTLDVFKLFCLQVMSCRRADVP